jgi:ATP-dependent helicase/nuclease subunit A
MGGFHVMTLAELPSSPELIREARPKPLSGSPMTTARGLTLISAGAGSGKTHRLTSVVAHAVSPEAATPVSPEGLLAVTFTRKAAAELEARIRRRLVTVGAHHLAQQLPLAYVGTVHAVCLRLIGEFAFDAGLSPLVKVISGDASRSLRQALEWGLEPALREKLEALASRLEIRFDSRIRRCDWLGPVQNIMNLARGNRIPPALLEGMAKRSSIGLRSLLGPPEANGDQLDHDLAAALTHAQAALDDVEDGQENTRAFKRRLMPLDSRSAKVPFPGRVGSPFRS